LAYTIHSYKVYALTNTAPDNEKDVFFDQLQLLMNASPLHELIFLICDFSEVFGSISTGFENVFVIMMEAEGVRLDNGKELISFCSANGLKIGGCLFKHR